MNTRSTSSPSSFISNANLVRIFVFVFFAALAIVPLFSTSSASVSLKSAQPLNAKEVPSFASEAKQELIDATKSLALPSVNAMIPLALLPQSPGSPAISTFDSSCATAQSEFNLNQSVCATATGTGGPAARRRITWVDPDGFIRQSVTITSETQSDTFTVPSTANSTLSNGVVVNNLGEWRVNIVGRTLVTYATFIVKDAANPTADIGVFKRASVASEQVAAGSAGVFQISMYNLGPDAAQNVTLTDVVPANTTFLAMVQTSGPDFSCVTPDSGSTGTVTCTLASFPRNTFVSFEFAYTVNAGTPSNSLITNTATVSASTADSNAENNTASASASVASTGGGCTLDCPNNISAVANQTVDGVLGAFVTFGAPEPFGSCGTITSSPASGTFFPVGSTAVNSSASNGGSCSFVVTVVENAPTISCPPNQTIAVAACAFEAVGVNPVAPTFTPADAVLTSTRSDDRPLNDPFPVGTTTITWTATDPDGHSASCSNTITVTSPETLSISCPANRTVTTAQNECAATITDLVTPTSNCNSTVQGVRSDGQALSNPYPAGVTTITWTATDANDHAVSCVQTITVNADDTVAPTVAAPPAVSVCTSGSSAFVSDEALGAATATDNCSVPSVTRTGVPAGNNFPTGTTTITYTATDSAGNTATATQTVTVGADDGQPPTITAPGTVTLSTGAGSASCDITLSGVEIDAILGQATASDTCSGVEVTRTGVPAGNVFPVGNTTITYTATDASGQTAQALQTVTVVDDTPPVIASCAANITVNTDAGSCTASGVNLGSPIATDNCTTVNATNDAPSAFPIGNTTVHWTVTDASGNTTSCDQVVTVEDHEAPTITVNGPNPQTVECHTSFSDQGATANDNCGSSFAAIASGSVDVNTVGTYTITYNATDASGNAATEVTRTINVVDTTAPTVSCPTDVTVSLPLNSSATSMAVSYATPTATESCSTATITTSHASGSVFPVGTTTVTVTATDTAGNSSTCTFNVTVLYNFTGFFSPVNNLPTLNAVNAGRAIPVKFSLSGDKGLNIMAPDNPYSVSFNCATNDPGVDILETNSAGGSSLSYSGGQYHYNWKTEDSWAGTCRQLVITLNDGSVHTANFKFK